MTFSKEQEEKLNELLDGKLNGLFTQIGSLLEDKIERSRRDGKKQTEDIFNSLVSDKLPEIISQKMEPLQKNLEFLDAVKAEWEKEEGQQQTTQKPSQQSTQQPVQQTQEPSQATQYSSAQNPEMIAMQKRLDALKTQLDESERVAAEARKKSEESEKAAALQQMNSRAIEAIINHNKDNSTIPVLPGREKQLLTLLKEDGLLIENSGSLKVKTRDKYGDEALVEIGDALPRLLEKEYSHFVAPRGGTGTGASQGSTIPAQGTSLNSLTSEEILNRAKAGGDTYDIMLRELEKSMQ